jgi:hypothetical protein
MDKKTFYSTQKVTHKQSQMRRSIRIQQMRWAVQQHFMEKEGYIHTKFPKDRQ